VSIGRASSEDFHVLGLGREMLSRRELVPQTDYSGQKATVVGSISAFNSVQKSHKVPNFKCNSQTIVSKRVVSDLCFYQKIWVRSGFGRLISGAFVRFGSHQCALVSISYTSYFDCHGRGRGFEPRRPRHKPKRYNSLWLPQSDKFRPRGC
jgi:hypothetical protein